MLAKELGMSLEQAQREISSAEFAEWMVYYEMDPFGGCRSDYQAGVVASTVFNMLRGKGGRTVKPEDFMPEWGESKEVKQTAKEMRNLFEFYVSMHNRFEDSKK